jgi:O-6-methylguanine DNA methyltransferase
MMLERNPMILSYRFLTQFGWLDATSTDDWQHLSGLAFVMDDLPRMPSGDLKEEPAIITQVKHYVLGDEVTCPPILLKGSDFQQDVWQVLQGIPKGETRSYAQVAMLIGRPLATRAVGTACGKNPMALLVPCHRVLQSDGGLGGYRWGLEKKRAILREEGVEVFQ